MKKKKTVSEVDVGRWALFADLLGFRPLCKQTDPSYSLLARLITSVAAQSHYWVLFFFFSLRSVSQLNSYSQSLLRVVLWTLLSDLLCCPFLSVSFNDFM